MFSQSYYLIRSRIDGSYLAAYPNQADDDQARAPADGYVLVFSEHADGLMYLNKFAAEVRDRFTIESLPGGQIASVLNRWGYKGLGMVNDPLLPSVDFLSKA
ncbi:hypothetical protein [Myxacorys almedinensis]|uniref:Uncharacterized protein n=1 Tax=Myxacorys almedinensis A TaxID=2690445 RepID=A0A8J7Z0J3_9CYAN|nr:hypothetical protein [Myxacorys almedinensis]NDJ15946.1 hypothetical protein [Myxacorys almedinensis A]